MEVPLPKVKKNLSTLFVNKIMIISLPCSARPIYQLILRILLYDETVFEESTSITSASIQYHHQKQLKIHWDFCVT